ncbi:unnamed protein product [Schistosoma guineensis]|nr:unnamed protein product [Schistosoma guineensis]
MKFKFTLLTSWTLLPTSIPNTDCEDNEAILFAQYLTEYTENKYGLNVFWPRQRGEAFLHNSFNSFEERFLTHSEYALLIVSGQNASCLNCIYPRFLVFLTAKKSWTERILIIFLKQPTYLVNFDLSLLKHPPILFNDDSTNQWIHDQESWMKVAELIKSYPVCMTAVVRSQVLVALGQFISGIRLSRYRIRMRRGKEKRRERSKMK